MTEPEPAEDLSRSAGGPSRSRSSRSRSRPPPRTTRADDEEAARLVALDMALGGSPREETEAYLAEHYQLADPDKLLDDVYELAGS